MIGGALIVPAGLLAATDCGRADLGGADPEVERLAMEAVMAAERALGREPVDVSVRNCGYDVESRAPGGGPLRFIEVKGRTATADTVCVTKNEILTGLNKPDDYLLAIVLVEDDAVRPPVYIHQPFTREPDFGVTSVNYKLGELLARAESLS